MAGKEPDQARRRPIVETPEQRAESLVLISKIYAIDPPPPGATKWPEERLLEIVGSIDRNTDPKTHPNWPEYRAAMRHLLFYYSRPEDRKTFAAAFHGVAEADLDDYMEQLRASSGRPANPPRPPAPPSTPRPSSIARSGGTPSNPRAPVNPNITPNVRLNIDSLQAQEKVKRLQAEEDGINDMLLRGRIEKEDIPRYVDRLRQISTQKQEFRRETPINRYVEETLGKTLGELPLAQKLSLLKRAKHDLEVMGLTGNKRFIDKDSPLEKSGFIDKGISYQDAKRTINDLYNSIVSRVLAVKADAEKRGDPNAYREFLAQNNIDPALLSNGFDASDADEYALSDIAQGMIGEEGVLPEFQREMRMGMFGDNGRLENYLFYDAMRQKLAIYRELNPEARKEAVINLVGTVLAGGKAASYAHFLLSAIQSDPHADPRESPIIDGIQFVMKVNASRGDKDPEHLYETISNVRKEFGAIMQAQVEIECVIEGKEKPERITLCPKDLLSTMYHTQRIGDILEKSDEPIDGGPGYLNARTKWFAFTIFRKLGYSEKQSEQFANEVIKEPQNRNPNIIIPNIQRTNQISLYDGTDVDSLGHMLGNNWWMYMAAEAALSFGRHDYGLAPLDEFQRRSNTGNRNPWMMDYDRTYGNEGSENWSAFQVLPELLAYVSDTDLLNIYLRKAGVPVKSSRLSDSDIKDILNRPENKHLKLRKKILESLMRVDVIAASESRRLGMIAMGVGEYDPSGESIDSLIESWKGKVRIAFSVPEFDEQRYQQDRSYKEEFENARKQSLFRIGIKKHRIPELWRFAEFDENEMREAWEPNGNKMEFSNWIKEAGVSEVEIARFNREDLKGVKGFKLFCRYASVNLWNFQSPDEGWRKLDDLHKYAKVAVNWLTTVKGVANRLKMPQPSEQRYRTRYGNVSITYNDIIKLAAGKFNELITGSLTEAKGKGQIVPNFIPSESQQRASMMVVEMQAYYNAAFRNDQYVEDIDIGVLGPDFSQYSVKRITRNSLKKQWKDVFDRKGIQYSNDDFNSVIIKIEEFLNGYGFYFIKSNDMKEEDAVLIGPHYGYVPAVKIAGQLYDEMIAYARKKGSEITEQELKRLKKEGYFSWARVRGNNISNWTPYNIMIMALAYAGANVQEISPELVERIIEEWFKKQDQDIVSDANLAASGWRYSINEKILAEKLFDFGLDYVARLQPHAWCQSKGGKSWPVKYRQNWSEIGKESVAVAGKLITGTIGAIIGKK